MKKTNRLYVNGRFLNQQLTGVQRFAIETTAEISKSTDFEPILLCSNRMKSHIELKNVKHIKIGFLWGHFWEQIELPIYLFLKKRPLLLNLTNSAPLFYTNKIYTLLDTSFKDTPDSFTWTYRTFYSLLAPMCLLTAKRIITISKFSKSRILANYKFLSEDKIKVAYCGIKNLKTTKNPTKENIILSVASLDPRKNTRLLEEAFMAFNRDDKFKLILVGKQGKAFSHTSMPKSNKNVIYATNVDDSELAELYASSKLFVSLSKYEGFGLPVLEALAQGTTVLCSDIEVYKELFSNYVSFTEIDSVKRIATKIKETIENNIFAKIDICELNKKYNWTIPAIIITDEIFKTTE
jgi:glycosyltransferase involved in cell wall biosynthesis